ncbi:hypothetical protein LG296_20640 (plasmid) [Ureibacillus chungkukjangi]|uniref:hypothetical protein n=1 Tax=Ureibacillus chungkukjangi TaxID=1202712 RepID=UPI000D3B63DA|nr:hypothetical protein [Ureibacillus chungkukjangi]
MTVLRGRCIDVENTSNLDEKTIYYLRVHTKDSYYVSRFDFPNAHMGAFQKRRFEIVEVNEEEPTNGESLFNLLGGQNVNEKEYKEEATALNQNEVIKNQLSFFELLDI